jgi:hypothetical protein
MTALDKLATNLDLLQDWIEAADIGQEALKLYIWMSADHQQQSLPVLANVLQILATCLEELHATEGSEMATSIRRQVIQFSPLSDPSCFSKPLTDLIVRIGKHKKHQEAAKAAKNRKLVLQQKLVSPPPSPTRLRIPSRSQQSHNSSGRGSSDSGPSRSPLSPKRSGVRSIAPKLVIAIE